MVFGMKDGFIHCYLLAETADHLVSSCFYAIEHLKHKLMKYSKTPLYFKYIYKCCRILGCIPLI